MKGKNMADDDFVPVTGVHLKKSGDYTIVCVEIGGAWIEVIRERSDGEFSHIVEPAGMYSRYFATSSEPPTLGRLDDQP